MDNNKIKQKYFRYLCESNFWWEGISDITGHPYDVPEDLTLFPAYIQETKTNLRDLILEATKTLAAINTIVPDKEVDHANQ